MRGSGFRRRIQFLNSGTKIHIQNQETHWEQDTTIGARKNNIFSLVISIWRSERILNPDKNLKVHESDDNFPIFMNLMVLQYRSQWLLIRNSSFRGVLLTGSKIWNNQIDQQGTENHKNNFLTIKGDDSFCRKERNGKQLIDFIPCKSLSCIFCIQFDGHFEPETKRKLRMFALNIRNAKWEWTKPTQKRNVTRH